MYPPWEALIKDVVLQNKKNVNLIVGHCCCFSHPIHLVSTIIEMQQHLNKVNNRIQLLPHVYGKLNMYISYNVHQLGVANGTSKNVGLGKFWQDLQISETFLISLEVSFLHGLFLLFSSLELSYQAVSNSDFQLVSRRLGKSRILPFATPSTAIAARSDCAPVHNNENMIISLYWQVIYRKKVLLKND